MRSCRPPAFPTALALAPIMATSRYPPGPRKIEMLVRKNSSYRFRQIEFRSEQRLPATHADTLRLAASLPAMVECLTLGIGRTRVAAVRISRLLIEWAR